jgi:hypothetical protein
MNCDQAFDYLTDSTRRDSGSLARHLAGCARCRQLKETLEPALDLFDDPVPEPGIDSFARAAGDEAVRIAEQSAARLSKRRLLSTRRLRSVVGCAAMFLIGAALVYGLTPPAGHFGADPAPANSICPWKNRTHADDAGLDATRVVLSCVDCHMAPASSPENTTSLRLEALRRSFSLALISSDWFAAPRIREADAMLAPAAWEAST